MNSTEEALIRALGLPPETSARRLATSTASVSDVADAASVRRSAQQLVANLTLFAASVWSGPTAGSEAVGALDARRHAEHPAVVVIDGSAGRVLKITGAVTAFEIDEGGAAPREVDVPGIPRDDAILCLDARSGAAGVALETSSGILLVHNDHGTLTTSVLDTGSNAVDFSDFRPAAPLARDLATPSPDALLEGVEAPDWLRIMVTESATSADPLARVGAVGTIGRLWSPRAAGEARRLMFETPERSPAMRIRAWARSLDAQAIDQLEAEAVAASDRLLDDLTRIAEAPTSAGELWPSVLCARDELASVALILANAGRGAALAKRLVDVDDRARGELGSLLVDESMARDPRWRAVARAEPDAWWGTVSDG